MLKHPTEESFQREKTRLTIRILVISAIVIVSVETIVMLVLDNYFQVSKPQILALDVLFLVIFVFPFNYFLIVRPLFGQVEAHYRANLELVNSYEIVERFFSIGDVMIAYLDADFNFIRVNEAYAEADQTTPEALIGKNHFLMYPNPENQAIFEEVVRTGKPYNAIEKPFEYAGHPERGISYWDWSLLPIKNSRGRVIALLFVLTDVTERKMAEMAREESERRFHAVFDQTYQHISLLDTRGRILVVNQTALDFAGLQLPAIAGKLLWEAPWWHASAEGLEPVQAAVSQAARGMIAHCENQLRSATGEIEIVDITIKPLLDQHGRPETLLYEARDISRHVRAEEALKRKEAEIRRLYQAEMRAHHFAETLRSSGLALSQSLDTDTVLETLLDHLQKVIPYQSAHISMVDDKDHMIVRHARGEESWDEDNRMLGKRFDISNSPILLPILNEGKSLSVPDVQAYTGPGQFPANSLYRSWLGMPLMAGDQVIGMCTMKHAEVDFFTQEMVEWAGALAGQAAVAIQNAWLFEQVRDGRERMQALSRRLVEVQESERHYIARELHDEAGQALASLMVGLRLIERESGDPAGVIARCQELKAVADGVLTNLHRLAINLRPASLDRLGLVAALRQHTEAVSDQHGLAIQFETVGTIERLPGEMETAIYRIVQEALTNVIKHAKATRVDILLERMDGKLLVVIEDNGIGFDPLEPLTNQLGVLGMRERADMLGGSITIESISGQGSTILLEVPCLFES